MELAVRRHHHGDHAHADGQRSVRQVFAKGTPGVLKRRRRMDRSWALECSGCHSCTLSMEVRKNARNTWPFRSHDCRTRLR